MQVAVYVCGMKSQFKNGEEYFFKLNQVFHAILGISLLPFGLIFIYKKKNDSDLLENEMWVWGILIILLLLILFLIYQSITRYKSDFKGYAKSWPLRQKLIFYYDINLRRFKYLGFATVIAVAGYFLDSQHVFLVAYVGLLFLMSLWRPAERKIEQHLALTKEEKQVLRERKEIE